MRDPLTLLLDSQLLTQADADMIWAYLDAHGGSLLNAIASQPSLDIRSLWQRLAESQERPFIGSLQDASPIDGGLIPREDATRHLILGRVLKFQTVHVITPDPFVSTADLLPLRDKLHGLTPGRHAYLRIEVCPPQLWKQLYDYTYPITPYSHPLSNEEAIALASLTPISTFEGLSLSDLRAHKLITPDQFAEAYARQTGVPYVNITQYPPDERLLEWVPLPLIRSTRQYPYGVTRDGQLITLSDTIPPPEIADLFFRVLQLRILPALTSSPAHSALMEALHDPEFA